MSGVWTFQPNGVINVVENPLAESSSGEPVRRRKILVHCASNETMTSFQQLDSRLLELGWRPYLSDEYFTLLRQYHQSSCSPHLISLPPFFSSLRTTHMYDIVVKTRSAFAVRDG